MPEDIFERDRNENTDDENYQVIAKFVSLLRSQETATDVMTDIFGEMKQAIQPGSVSATKVRTQFAEFTKKDAMRLVAEIAEETGQSKNIYCKIFIRELSTIPQIIRSEKRSISSIPIVTWTNTLLTPTALKAF